MRTYKIYAAGSGTANNVASVTMVKSGRIKSFRWAVDMDMEANTDAVALEASLTPTSQIGTNDTIGVIDEVRSYANVAGTEAGIAGQINTQRTLDFPIGAGERIYINAVVTTAAYRATLFIDVAD